MSSLNVYIAVPDYLEQWLRHEFWNNETGRVEFPRGSAPRAVLHSLLTRPPKGLISAAMGSKSEIPVEVPSFKGINPNSFCWLSDSGKKALVSCLKKLFQSMMWQELFPLLGYNVQITDVVYAFLDNHGIEPTPQNWETIRQMFFRMRKKTAKSDDSSNVNLS